MRVKRSDEELKKLTDILNGKFAKSSSLVQSLEDLFTNEDLERKNEIFMELTSKLDKCNQDINGQNKMNDVVDSSLQAKRNLVIEEINDIAGMLNNKRAREVSDVIEHYQKILKTATAILLKIQNAKAHAVQIDKSLDVLCTSTV